ncbi:hypothetical protein MNV49_002816 [Pseudohyphozyma bogoriensis]|nr:hypothetical protein MNV49_002816 [Pseudohyphozyma bogoriensis]
MPVGVDSVAHPTALPAGAPQQAGPFPKRKLILNAFDMFTPSHIVPGTWTAETKTHEFDTLSYWIETAKLLERGKFHGIFLADSYGTHDVPSNPKNLETTIRGGLHFPKLDPLLLVSAMASVTTNLAFGVTSSTTYEPPFALARRYTTLDHLTNGRIAWNIVTSGLASAARNFGLTEAIEHDKRYEIADEYMDVVYKLWESSWHDEAVKRDQEKGIWTEPSLVRPINHRGTYFKDIPGPHAEAVFITQPNYKIAALKVAEYRAKVAEAGRDPRSLKVIPGLVVFVGKTSEEAQEKYEYWKSKGDAEVGLAFMASNVGADVGQFEDDDELVFPPGTGGAALLGNYKRMYPDVSKWTRAVLRQYFTLGPAAIVAGSASEIADEFERWIEIGDVDGFNLSHYSRNNCFEDIVNIVVPELQRRGLFWEDYPEVTQPAGATERIGITAREGLLGVGQPRLQPTHYAGLSRILPVATVSHLIPLALRSGSVYS